MKFLFRTRRETKESRKRTRPYVEDFLESCNSGLDEKITFGQPPERKEN